MRPPFAQGLPEVEIDFTPPFARIPMIAGLEEALGVKFPDDLASDEANSFLQVLALTSRSSISIRAGSMILDYECARRPNARSTTLSASLL